jgi:hypothetical protein
LFRINYLIYFYFFCLLFLKKITWKAANKFYEYINSDEISNRNQFSNIVKTTLDFNDDFLFENSAKHSLSDSIFIFPDDTDARNQFFKCILV